MCCSPVVVSVVRDKEMYSRCVSANPHLGGCTFVLYDNAVSNLSVTSRYNSFLDTLVPGCSRWIVFCHEDWEVKEKLADVLDSLDKSRIYGPIGAYLQRRKGCDYLIYKGEELQSLKDGGSCKKLSFPLKSGRVDTLDCQCLIVHSSLVLRYGLRFDENLTFDLYAEDFCAGAHTGHGVLTEVTHIDCHHHSLGTISESFRHSLAYLDSKYCGSAKRFASIVGYKTVFGGEHSRPVHRTRFPRLSSFLEGLL